MCRLYLSPAARSTAEQVRSPAAIPQVGVTSPEGPESIDQVRPAPEPAGSGSSRVTPFAVPGPALETVTVNPIVSPSITHRPPASTPSPYTTLFRSILSSPVASGAFVAEAVAVLS